MKKLFLSLIVLLLAAASAFAQDLITTKDGTDIKAKILEVTSTEVKYKKYNNLDGPTFTLRKSEILIVRYENGENEVFSGKNGYKANTDKEIYEGMKFREYKNYYNPKMYMHQEGDPYSRFWCGTASFFIPGLGEACEGVWGRAAAFFFGNIGLYIIQASDAVYDSYGYVTSYGTVGTIAGLARIGVNIWSIVDAVRIAKIKNMYYQDIRGQRAMLDVNLEPYFAYTPTGVSNTLTPTAGFTLKMNF